MGYMQLLWVVFLRFYLFGLYFFNFNFSLLNMLKVICWSLDLCWQRFLELVGFYGLKEGLLMRLFKDFGMKIDWVLFDVVNCYDKQMVVMIGKVGMFFMFLIKCLNCFFIFYLF